MANLSVTNPTPKTRFIESGTFISEHREMVDSKPFQRAIDFAILEYCGKLHERVANANAAMEVGLCLRGAHEFIGVLRNLSESPEPPKAIPGITPLNYKA